jgi:hypothetical protein
MVNRSPINQKCFINSPEHKQKRANVEKHIKEKPAFIYLSGNSRKYTPVRDNKEHRSKHFFPPCPY